MTQAKKLEALVQRGFDCAWEFDNLDKWQFKAVRKTDTVRTDWWQVIFTHGDKTVMIDAERILFDELFARALFGEATLVGAIDGEQETFWAAWKIHLMRAVISKDPIDYMYKAVSGEIPRRPRV